MSARTLLALVALLALSACQGASSPEAVGYRVGRSLDNASARTGEAIGVARDRTGQTLQNAGSSLQGNPPPPSPYAY